MSDEQQDQQKVRIRTIYTIHESTHVQHSYQTTDPEVAEMHSRHGLRVTAECKLVIL